MHGDEVFAIEPGLGHQGDEWKTPKVIRNSLVNQ